MIARTIILTVTGSVAAWIVYEICVDPLSRIFFGVIAVVLALIWASENA
jgi:hypothetical protein